MSRYGMRGVVLLMVLATAALADPLPSMGLRGGRSSPFVIGPSTLGNRLVPAGDVETLRRRAAIARGAERVEVIEALTAILENQDPPDELLDLQFREIAAWYVILLKEPALEKATHADELLLRGAKNVMSTDEALAGQALERVIAKFPRSPYIADARMQLAESAERKRQYGEATTQLRAIIASRDATFANYARVRLGWVFAQAGNAKAAVAELAGLTVDGVEPYLVDIALEIIIAPYAQVGRADLAAALFDLGDRAETATRLRRLASEYSDKGKFADANTVLRAAMAHDADPTALCLDRADIVYVTSQGKNKVDLALAIAELAEARKSADATCGPVAELALARAKRPAR